MTSPTTFDASTAPDDASVPASTADPFEPGGPAEASLLDQLRERVEERDDAEPDEWTKEIPKVGIRLVFDVDIDSADYQRWQRSAQPRRKGRGRTMSSALDMDLLALSVRAMTATCQRLEIRRGETWSPMTGPSGEVYDLESRELLSAFNVIDSGALLRKLFGRDARIIDAGQELLAEAGYLDGGDDDDNPE